MTVEVITRWQFSRFVINLKISSQFFNPRDAKPKPIAPCTREFFRALRNLQAIAGNSDWFSARFAPVLIARSNYFGIGFSPVI